MHVIDFYFENLASQIQSNQELKINVFIDTEFTDLLDPILISIGMVADTGEEFYAEVPYPDEKCTPFVREAVLPQLGGDADRFCSLSDLSVKLRQWLQQVRKNDETVYVCFDYITDWDLFLDVIQFKITPWVQGKLINSDIDEILLYEFYKDTGLSRHHALNDARANKFAYRTSPVKLHGEKRRRIKIRRIWREKLPKQFIKNTLRSIRELKSGMTAPYVFERASKKQILKGSFRGARQPGSLKDRIAIADDFNAPLTISEQIQNIPDAGDDTDWVRNPITPELLAVLNDRVPAPLDTLKETGIRNDGPLDPMIYSDDFDSGKPFVLSETESLMILDTMENPPPSTAAFLKAMAKYKKLKDAQWQQTKPIICRSRFIDPKDGSDEMIVPVPGKLLQELRWTEGNVLEIQINENKELVLRKK